MTTYRVPPRVAYVVPAEDSGAGGRPVAFLMRLPDGAPVVIRDSAAMIWVLAADGEEDVAAAVGDLVGLGREEVADDVLRFLDDLVDRGLLDVDTSSVDRHSP